MTDIVDVANNEEAKVDQAVAEGGAYELIKSRLLVQGEALRKLTENINTKRQQEFGSKEIEVSSRVRVRTENNCVARDLVQVGDTLLFGYNVFIGLKTTTSVRDVFALYKINHEDQTTSIQESPLENSFLSSPAFVKDFDELYRYYKHTKLIQLSIIDGKLLMGFQIGERIEDVRVFRWVLSADGSSVEYIDNRGERDIQLPLPYDFEWQECMREHVVHGRHPHLNILDTVFVECMGGDLTVKVENNTEDGRGIYREDVENKTQSLDDGDYFYAKLGDLILLKIRPYQENLYRFLVFNTLTQSIVRIDALAASCVQLPEDHGLVFPGGYYLQSGEHKLFSEEHRGLRYKRTIRSPNGEDVLFVFYEQVDGVVALLSYNMINRSLQNPIYAHGYALAADGTLVLFSADTEPTRVHPMQIWSTPFVSDEHASNQPESQTFFGRIGNADLVRGISDVYGVCRLIENQSVSSRVYEEMSHASLKIFDDHYWVSDSELDEWSALLREVSETANLAIEEFEKVQSIRHQSELAFGEAEEKCTAISLSVTTASWEKIEDYVKTLNDIRHLRGHLATIKQYRYINLEDVESLEKILVQQQDTVSERTVGFLSKENSLEPYHEQVLQIQKDLDQADTVVELDPVIEKIEQISAGLDLLSELLSSLDVNDTTLRTRIIDAISDIYSKLNQSKANAQHKKKDIGSDEAVAEFSAQFKLYSQSITNGLSLAQTPDKCDEQMSKLLVRLEEIESQFGAYEIFLGDIVDKRDEIYELFESHKQRLLDERQAKAQSIYDAAERAIASIERRAAKFTSRDELNTYFAADSLVLKIHDFIGSLTELSASVKADDIDAKYKAVKEQAVRILRDKADIYEEGGGVIKLGPRHRFSVNQQELDLTIMPRGGVLNLHLNGTDYFDQIEDNSLVELKAYWDITLRSESDHVYRSEYLAYSILKDEEASGAQSMQTLSSLVQDDALLLKKVSQYATPRYKEGYDRGIHDYDACQILKQLVPALESADLLRFPPEVRGFAQVFWANIQRITEQLENKRLTYETWRERAQSAEQLQQIFHSSDAQKLLAQEVADAMREFIRIHPMAISDFSLLRAADYLVFELGRERLEFIGSKYAQDLVSELKRYMTDESWRRFQLALEKMMGWPAERWNLSCSWLAALVKEKQLDDLSHYIDEAAALINADERIDRRLTEVDLNLEITGLMGEHSRIKSRSLLFSLDEFLLRISQHDEDHIPNYERYLEKRQSALIQARESLKLNEFKPRPLSSFVRNRLINESYLPLIGDNLAKQMGTVGDTKRSDLMGLLMMISPPGYGKTTLMEYVASRLGLIFMKINCPSLGHEVTSLDADKAPNATAMQELVKLNLGLEMGNNVMLYLDDIQHTHPEFLQKFISLCDGTRRIEGIWKGRTKTYDMRGKKFCVVMAGNPYTESGEVFKIPDMLANRADIYNLGDVLGGKDEIFALSYVENCLTSNQVLAQLANRELKDVYLFVDMALGKDVASTDFSHSYSAAETKEIVAVLKKLFIIRDVVLKVNQAYIASAAQADQYRIEPPFKLQGSYRNMNKMAEKISSVMNEAELMQLIEDHYLGEAQLLTAGAEENLLKLAELRGNLSQAQSKRWLDIKDNFKRQQSLGGADQDTGQKVVGQLHDLVGRMDTIASSLDSLSKEAHKHSVHVEQLAENEQESTVVAEDSSTALSSAIEKPLLSIQQSIELLAKTLSQNTLGPNVEVINQPVPGMNKLLGVMAKTIESSIYPLIRTMDKKLDIDLRTHDKLGEVSKQLRDLQTELSSAPPKRKTRSSKTDTKG